MANQNNQESTSFYDQADGKFDQAIQGQTLLTKGVTADDAENSAATYSENLMADADAQVRATEDASLQDDAYAFDEENTGNEEFHDLEDDDGEELDFDDE
ncbi:MAG TPA: hypothetical protein VNJ01_04975 [Bacteriovoracaceae bacterium]|nr:hypothetical protein [Bacteriovoracaceae bacterium]